MKLEIITLCPEFLIGKVRRDIQRAASAAEELLLDKVECMDYLYNALMTLKYLIAMEGKNEQTKELD